MSSMLVLTRSATKKRRSWQVQRRSRRRASIKYHIGRGEGKSLVPRNSKTSYSAVSYLTGSWQDWNTAQVTGTSRCAHFVDCDCNDLLNYLVGAGEHGRRGGRV